MRQLFFLCLLMVVIACEKALLPAQPSNDPESNFEVFWQTMHQRYAYFDLKPADWQALYQHYRPQIDAHTSPENLFAIMDTMLYQLEDGHVNLISDFNLSRNWQWYLDYPDNFDFDLVERQYLGVGHRIAGGMRYAWLQDSIGYLYLSSFSSSLSRAQLDAVFRYFKDSRGLIIDIRHNGGGSVSRAYALAQRIVRKRQDVLTRFYKTGPGPDQFALAGNIAIGPSDQYNYRGEVALLTNRRSYSAANSFAAILSSLDHVRLIGDQTGGGGGIPLDYELPNGWRFRFSATREVKKENGRPLELGIPPDIALDLDTNALLQGRDVIIERALQELR